MAPPAFPLRTSANGRYLEDQNGVPVPILGRTAWFVISLPATDFTVFLNDSLSRGYNAIEMHVLDHDPRGSNPPRNGNGDLPFLKRLDGAAWSGSLTYGNIGAEAPDFTTPNEAYWSFVDDFLATCESQGVLVFFFPAYVGFAGGNQGWMQEMVANGATRMSQYGAFLATRYQNSKNIVWMMGGDMGGYTAAQNAVESALISGLKSVAGQSTHFSAEWDSNSVCTDQATYGSNCTLNGAYSFGGQVVQFARNGYNHRPVIPTFLLEEPYDQEGPDGNNFNPNATQPVRRFQIWGWLSGIAGYVSGNGFVWQFRQGWQTHLDTQGARDMARLNTLIRSFSWQDLVPSGLSGMKPLITAGGGATGGSDYVAAAATPGGTLLVAYVPPTGTANRSFSVDMTAMSGPSRARWWNPTSGAFTDIASGIPNTGATSFTTPGDNGTAQNDWILVVTPAPTSAPPAVATAASATPNPIAGTTTALSALGADDNGEAGLVYTWTAAGTPAPVSFSPNGSNAAKNATATFGRAGTYALQVAIADADGQTVTSSVTVTVNQTPTGIAVTPAVVAVAPNAAQQFTATATDQFGAALAAQPGFDWSVNGGGSIDANGLFTAGAAVGGPFAVTAAAGGASGTASVTVSSAPTPVYRVNSGGNANGSFSADRFFSGGSAFSTTNAVDTSGATNPAPAGVYQSERVGNFTYTFSGLTAGASYTVRLHFSEIWWTSSGARLFNVSINGAQVLTSFDIYAAAGGAFKAVVRDFTASANASGQMVVQYTTVRDNAKSSGIEVFALAPSSAPPTVATPASATPNPVTGTTTALSVLGDDDAGEAGLVYTWAASPGSPAPVAFSPNGTNAARSSTATFAKTGTYGLQVTIAAPDGQTVTSSVTVAVSQTPGRVVVAPASVTVAPNATQQFTATAFDQFGFAMAAQPAFSWTVNGGGAIDSTGLFTAGSAASGSFTVLATVGTAGGTASVTVSGGTATVPVYRLNSGGNAAGTFSADRFFSGGSSFTSSSPVDVSGVTNPPPAAVYQSERVGNFTYTLSGLTAGASYTVRLHFAEIWWTSSGARLFNVSINGAQVLANFDIYAAAGGAFKAVARDFTAMASASGQLVLQYATVRDNAKSSAIEVLALAPSGQPPTVATPAAATPNPVAGTTTALSVLGADDGGEASLVYTWAASGAATPAVSFSPNGTNAAKDCTATFARAGTYTLQATIASPDGQTTTSSVTVAVNQTLTAVAVAPANATVAPNATQQFTATAVDQFGSALGAQPSFAWTASGGGAIDANGLFTAGATVGGPFTVTASASAGGASGAASVTVSSAPTPIFRVNSGGNAVGGFSSDRFFSGGNGYTSGRAVDTSGTANPAPAAVYQSERYGNFTYTFSGLTPGASVTVRLHFAEVWWTDSGMRVFNVSINGAQALTNFDIYAAAGGAFKAISRDFTAIANTSGQVVVQYVTVKDNAKSSGIELF